MLLAKVAACYELARREFDVTDIFADRNVGDAEFATRTTATQVVSGVRDAQ